MFFWPLSLSEGGGVGEGAVPNYPMRNVRHCCLLCLLLCVLPPSAHADDWYRPLAADFRPVYDRDLVNRRAEGWDGGNGYWFWVQSFYNGYQKRVFGLTVFRQSGWTATGASIGSAGLCSRQPAPACGLPSTNWGGTWRGNGLKTTITPASAQMT